MQPAGYSGTPLAKKPGLKAGAAIKLVHAPARYRSLFESWLDGVTEPAGDAAKDLIHLFAGDRATLQAMLPALKRELQPDGALWVSWPKKAAKVPADLTENDIRDLALEIGLVDVKVCAVDGKWSGLKLVIPMKLRGGAKA